MNMELLRERLIEARLRLKLTRADVSRMVDVPYKTITNYENGQREPGHIYLTKLADLCGVTTDWLLGRTDNPHGDGKTPPPMRADQAAKLISACQSLTDRAIDKVIVYAVDLSYNPANKRQPPLPEMTPEELHAELERQLALEKDTRTSEVS